VLTLDFQAGILFIVSKFLFQISQCGSEVFHQVNTLFKKVLIEKNDNIIVTDTIKFQIC